MAKYGECISGRPSYQTHRQTYYPALAAAAAAAAAASLNGEAEAVDASSGAAEKNSRSGGGGGGGGVGQGGARFPSSSSTNNKPTGTASVTTGTISQRDPVYPRSLAEEVVWRQRRFAWWGTTYLVDPLSAVHPPPSKIHPNPAQLKVQQILQQLRNKDVSLPITPPPDVFSSLPLRRVTATNKYNHFRLPLRSELLGWSSRANKTKKRNKRKKSVTEPLLDWPVATSNFFFFFWFPPSFSFGFSWILLYSFIMFMIVFHLVVH
jgi:hypothetical protein